MLKWKKKHTLSILMTELYAHNLHENADEEEEEEEMEEVVVIWK